MRVGTCLLVRTAKEDLAENTIRVVEEEMDHGCLRKGIQKEKKKKKAGAKALRQACAWRNSKAASPASRNQKGQRV